MIQLRAAIDELQIVDAYIFPMRRREGSFERWARNRCTQSEQTNATLYGDRVGGSGPLSHNNMCKDDQTLLQALATVADDERVGHIIHSPSRYSHFSHQTDIRKILVCINLLAPSTPASNCDYCNYPR